MRPAAQATEFRQPAEAAQIVELLLRQVDISGDARDVAVLRSSLCPILKMIEDGHPITDVFIEKRATLISAAHNAKEATVGVSNLRREPAEKHVIQGAAIAIAKALPLNPTFAAAAPRRVPWLR
jgi:hypothetical protein